MATTKTSLQMEFLTDMNKRVRIVVPNPKQPVDSAAVSAAMDLIVAKNVFTFPQGVIVKKGTAQEVATDTSAV